MACYPSVTPESAAPYALLFDIDGVLIGSTREQALAFQLLSCGLGLTTNARRWLPHRLGHWLRRRDTIRYILGHLGLRRYFNVVVER